MASKHKKNDIFLVSGCLIGLLTRYDGEIKRNDACLEFLQDKIWIPVCPEQLGGLPTPRPPADIINGDGNSVLDGETKVMTKTGLNVSEQFINGAHQVLAIAHQQQVCGVCLKARSPSCAVTGVQGVTAALLHRHGFKLYEF